MILEINNDQQSFDVRSQTRNCVFLKNNEGQTIAITIAMLQKAWLRQFFHLRRAIEQTSERTNKQITFGQSVKDALSVSDYQNDGAR
jgi:hypothetical protein